MRIFVVSNFYPPHYIGGYEIGCSDVVKALKARGHQIEVLTSTHGIARPESDGQVHRWLETDHDWRQTVSDRPHRRARMEFQNRRAMRRAITRFKPDVVYLWNMAQISLSAAHVAAERNIPVCCYVFDGWLAGWQHDAWYERLNATYETRPRVLLQRIARVLAAVSGLSLPPDFLDVRHVQFASQYLKGAALSHGKPVQHAKVIHWGLHVEQYPYRSEPRPPLRLLFVGQVVPEKGVHTALQAVRILVVEKGCRAVHLTVAGGSIQPAYEADLRRKAVEWGLGDNVTFTGMLKREQVEDLYQSHDILIFPSVWEEPFGITILEAMASGLVVVGTHTGGTPEIMKDGDNSITFPKDDPQKCAEEIYRLIHDADLYSRIQASGRRSVEQNFRFETTVDKIEADLLSLVV